jgi:hypothetical protein
MKSEFPLGGLAWFVSGFRLAACRLNWEVSGTILADEEIAMTVHATIHPKTLVDQL